ncbi:hypothetical protein ES288_D03G089600v1 [Gossypium darwinii]|uniref:K-box domain-containing protein n=1 Tax=Gossypium darwinii TaxID=34276 RepID=A0A5D2D3E1_GOSDA|nr:hypothetical protein ES288_D03G089600v1 [Gossypium darwinii]
MFLLTGGTKHVGGRSLSNYLDGIRQREQILLEQFKRCRLQEQKAILENQSLRKQVEELQQKTSSNSLDFNPLQTKISLNTSKPDFHFDHHYHHHSDTSLHLDLGLSSDDERKRKLKKIEADNNDLESQIA